MKGFADHNLSSGRDAIKSQSASPNLGETDASKDSKSPIVEVMDGSSSILGLGQVDTEIGKDPSCSIPQVSDVAVGRSGSKITPDRKPMGSSVKATGKDTAMFRQPLTDSQQVQMRAQILVYGSLIRGMAPDEAYMTLAFGDPEKSRGKAPSPANSETPSQSHSAVRAPDLAYKQSGLNKDSSSSVGQESNRGTLSNIVNPVPPTSPLGSITTPSCDAPQSRNMAKRTVMDSQQLLSPLHPYQNPVRNFGHTGSRVSQSSIHSSWVSSAEPSGVDARPSVLPITGSVSLTPFKDQSVTHPSAMKHVSPGPMVQSGGPASVLVGTTPSRGMKKVTVSSGLTSAVSKFRKRTKNPNIECTGQISLQSQSRTKPVLTPSSHQFASVVSTIPSGFVFKSTSEEVVIAPTPTTDRLKEPNSEQRNILSEENLSKVKEARQQAEDAAALAAIALCHREEVCNQLNRENISGLVTDVEAKLASAAVAIAAAASVVKAAAAAAKVASSAALQAKLMADEALSSSACGNHSQIDGISLSDSVTTSILKGEDIISSSSTVIVATREAARKRVEAATAASKQAENLETLVKAAELAAEAVSHAGKIVSMADPMPLSELVGHGPDNYWRVTQASSELVTKSNDVNSYVPRETSKQLIMHGHVRDGILGYTTSSEMDSRGQRGRQVSDSHKPSKLVPEVETGCQLGSVTVHDDYAVGVPTPKLIDIKEGSHVEVYKDGDGLKSAWFSANVLSLKDGKAYVSYTELLDGGSGPLKEWVVLGGEVDNPPRIRIARAKANMKFKGTRKRSRAIMGDYNWSIGDKIDAYIQNSWCEGMVTDKSNKDETMVTVYFPDKGETSVVRAWDLRPSLIWREGDWIEWSREGENTYSTHEGDTPQEKRFKFRSPIVVKGKNKMSKNIDVETRKPENIRLMDLSMNQNVFIMGKSTSNENNPDPHRTLSIKEGSRVISGIPKPVKRRRFVDVSKHYVADGKSNEANDSVTVSKSFLPQGSGSHGWKYKNKRDFKGKHAVESKSKVPKSGNLQCVSGRTINQKDNFSTDEGSAYDVGTTMDKLTKIKDSEIDNELWKQKQIEFRSSLSNENTTRGSMPFSSFPPSSKKVPTSTPKADQANKGKVAPAGGKLGKIEDNVLDGIVTKSSSEAVEPRRSIRKIQPTSKLLEGLQSSFTFSEIPPFSHARTHKSRNRNASKGNNKSRGGAQAMRHLDQLTVTGDRNPAQNV